MSVSRKRYKIETYFQWMAPVLVTLNDLESHLPVARLFKGNLSNICAAFYQISTDIVFARSLSDGWAPCFTLILFVILLKIAQLLRVSLFSDKNTQLIIIVYTYRCNSFVYNNATTNNQRLLHQTTSTWTDCTDYSHHSTTQAPTFSSMTFCKLNKSAHGHVARRPRCWAC